MAKTTANKGKQAAKRTKDEPRIKPPGVILSGEASDSGKDRSSLEPGSMRLRSLLELSDSCPMDQVCTDAADAIENLRLSKHRQ